MIYCSLASDSPPPLFPPQPILPNITHPFPSPIMTYAKPPSLNYPFFPARPTCPSHRRPNQNQTSVPLLHLSCTNVQNSTETENLFVYKRQKYETPRSAMPLLSGMMRQGVGAGMRVIEMKIPWEWEGRCVPNTRIIGPIVQTNVHERGVKYESNSNRGRSCERPTKSAQKIA